MTAIEYRRLADARPPERELLAVATDGTCRAWRSNGPVIGRFEGPVPDSGQLATLATSAASADPPAIGDRPAGAAAETLVIEGRTVRLPARPEADDPWRTLAAACRTVLDAITDFPVAAIGGELTPGGSLRLAHRGVAALPVELASLRVVFHLWRDGLEVARGEGRPAPLGRVDAGPGWELEVAPRPALPDGGGIVVAEASFVADDEGVFVPVMITVHHSA